MDNPGALDLVTTEELVNELIRRHTGEHRSLIVSSVTPKEGTIDQMELRSIVVANNTEMIICMIKAIGESVKQKPQ